MNSPLQLPSPHRRINLGSGNIQLPGYWNVDIHAQADIVLDLERDNLPFPDDSVDSLVCISVINYFTRERAQILIQEVFRVLKPGGLTRFASQDLRILTQKYLQRDDAFYRQKLASGQERFPGETLADKLNAFFYGFPTAGNKHCQYVYDFETLSLLFHKAGFVQIQQKNYLESQLPDIDKIDNRPEQMFFLEANKPSKNEITVALPASPAHPVPDQETRLNSPSLTDLPPSGTDLQMARELWKTGRSQKAWQYLLKSLTEHPDDREAVLMAGEILIHLQKNAEASQLYQEYLQRHSQDLKIQQALTALINSPTKSPLSKMAHPLLASLKTYQNPVLSDREHLQACMHWLRRAQQVTGNGGVAATYNLQQQEWGVAYPETTGYIIPTFLAYAHLTGKEEYRASAVEMGNWEIEIQWPDGGVGEPLGVYGHRPRVFNTSQVILGWLALYRETQEPRYLTAAELAGHWIVAQQDSDGKWTKSTFNGPKSYKIRVAWSLLELFACTQYPGYRQAAQRAIQWVLSQAHPNGWFASQNLAVAEPWTHLIGYTLQGLLEICLLDEVQFDRATALHSLQQAAHHLCHRYHALKQSSSTPFLGLPGTLNSQWSSQDSWSCVTGNAQIAFFLHKLATHYTRLLTVNQAHISSIEELNSQARLLEWLQVANGLHTDLKKIHWVTQFSADENLYGGLPGSHPIEGPYLTNAIPNWGVKFFADTCLQKTLPEEWLRYLG